VQLANALIKAKGGGIEAISEPFRLPRLDIAGAKPERVGRRMPHQALVHLTRRIPHASILTKWSRSLIGGARQRRSVGA
jgi:hypothetical protein